MSLLSEKLRNLDMRISDLSNYLKIDRKVLYKYIELYEVGERDLVDERVVNLFDYVSNTKNIGIHNVINFILDNYINPDFSHIEKLSKLCKYENISQFFDRYLDRRSLIVDLIHEFFKNKYPSLEIVDLDNYHCEVTITDGVNDIYYGWDNSDWLEFLGQDLTGKEDSYEKIDNALTDFYNEIYKKYL